MGILTSILHGNRRCISELDVGLLNHSNQTSITQVMVHFPELLQLKLNGLCPDFGTIRGLVSELSLELSCGLLWLVVWNFLWHLYATICLEDQVVIA